MSRTKQAASPRPESTRTWRPKPDDIRRYIPRSLDEISGNHDLKQWIVDSMSGDIRGRGTSIMLGGPRRSGISSAIKFYLRSLMCPNRAPLTFAPCRGQDCRPCQHFDHREAQIGLSHVLGFDLDGEYPVQILPVHCGKVDRDDLLRDLPLLKEGDGVRVIVLEEAGELARKHLDDFLVTELDDRDAVWIALDPDFEPLRGSPLLDRFDEVIFTQLPRPDEFSEFVLRRCIEWEIAFDRHDPALFVDLGQRTDYRVGRAYKALAIAARTRRVLTRDIVERLEPNPAGGE